MSKTTAGTFRHLSAYRIEGTPRGPWSVIDTATGKRVAGPFRVFRSAWLRRKALIAGVSDKVARGLPS